MNNLIIVHFSSDLGKIEEALGDKLSTFAFYMAIFISGIIFALTQGWQLALICLIYLPVSIITMGLVTWVRSSSTLTKFGLI